MYLFRVELSTEREKVFAENNASMLVLFVLSVLSVIAFILFGIDKRRAIRQRWRIPERTLLAISFFGGAGGLLGMLLFHHKTRKWKFRILVPLFAVLDLSVIAFLLWASAYYSAGETAAAALQSDGVVSVEESSTAWMFDGPSEDRLLIFYPGAKVEETAYAPLLRKLAEEEMDVCLVKMPLHLAFFGINRADKILEQYPRSHFYIGGHSLGGAMAAYYAAAHENTLDGIILLAAYPVKEMTTDTLLIYGSEDGILNMDRVGNAEALISGRYREYIIDGGNHAQFGDYGEQLGDGAGRIDAQRQQELTVQEIGSFLNE